MSTLKISDTGTVVSFPDNRTKSNKPYVLVIGINSAIGDAIAKQYEQTYQIVGIARDIHKANHQYTLVQSNYSETELLEIQETLKGISSEYALIINCIGLLHNAIVQPEKALRNLSERSLSEYFYVNATLPALLLKFFTPLLSKNNQCVYANLSAMVGSISDNKLGGWYGYRASKAALNMLTKTAAIELSRSNKNAAIIALHPGTTKSKLSAPFTQNYPDEKLYSAELTATRLKKVLESITPKQSGSFFHWDGKQLEW